MAIFIEERNAQLYHRFAEMFVSFQDLASLDIAGILWDMAIEERHHSSLLQQRYTVKYGQASCAITDADISEMIELPQLDGSGVFNPNLDASDAKRHALEIALKAENMARAFYTELAQFAGDADLQALYVELAAFEEDHVRFLELRLSSQTPTRSGIE